VSRGSVNGPDGRVGASLYGGRAKSREQLSKEWEQFPAEIRANCTREATAIANVRSYVELLTCLQIAMDVKKLPND
jgi:hypothetical protein